MTDYADPDLETVAPLPPPPGTGPTVPSPPPPGTGPTVPSPPPPGREPFAAIIAALVVVALVVGFGVATLVLNARDKSPGDSASAQVPTQTTPSTLPSAATTVPTDPTVPAGPADPDESVLADLIVNQRDVPAADTVHHLTHGADTTVATLDLCNGTFPSESQRTARRQVDLTSPDPTTDQDVIRLSTEAVLYGHPSGGTQAFSELRSVAAKCPATPVKSPVGEDTATTKFRAAPDGSWPRVATVDRLAFDFDTTDATTGQTTHSMAVYLRRGRVLMGVYFADPDHAQIAVDGRTTIAGIVQVFEQRIADLPAAVVNR